MNGSEADWPDMTLTEREWPLIREVIIGWLQSDEGRQFIRDALAGRPKNTQRSI